MTWRQDQGTQGDTGLHFLMPWLALSPEADGEAERPLVSSFTPTLGWTSSMSLKDAQMSCNFRGSRRVCRTHGSAGRERCVCVKGRKKIGSSREWEFIILRGNRLSFDFEAAEEGRFAVQCWDMD